MSGSPSQQTLYRRITASVPLLVTVIVHAILFIVAGVFIVSTQIIDKKKTFDAAPPAGETAVQKQVDRRLSIARKGGASSNSPVSSQRILSADANALAIPMPDLPVGAAVAGLGGFGVGAGAGLGGGNGFATGGGATGGLGGKFFSPTFLGQTSPNVQKVVFAVDISSALLDIRKGGFQAFGIIRDEISRLVSTMPPATEFNVILFDAGTNEHTSNLNLLSFRKELTPATLDNKQALINWMAPINTDMNALGLRSVKDGVRWTPRKLANAGLDPQYRATNWTDAFRAALEMKPDVVFLITGRGVHYGNRDATQKEIDDRRKAREARLKDYEKRGIDLVAVAAARKAAFEKASAQFAEINKQQLAKKKDPFIIQHISRVMDNDFQTELKKAGYTLVVDTKGWTDKEGRIIRDGPYDPTQPEVTWTTADYKDLRGYYWKLQAALSPQKKTKLNLFLFVGPDENVARLEVDVKQLAKDNDGAFSILDTKKLEALKHTADEEAKKR